MVWEKTARARLPGRSLWVVPAWGPAVAAQEGSVPANELLLTTMLGGTCRGPWVGVHVWGGGFLFKRQGGWNGGSQLAVGSISTDKALPCRCEEFQLNMQPICLCVGEGLLGRRERRQRRCGIPANQKLAPFITGTRGFPQPSCALPGVCEGDRQRKRVRLGRRVLQTQGLPESLSGQEGMPDSLAPGGFPILEALAASFWPICTPNNSQGCGGSPPHQWGSLHCLAISLLGATASFSSCMTICRLSTSCQGFRGFNQGLYLLQLRC